MSSLHSHTCPVPSDQARCARGQTGFSIGGAIDPGESLVDAAVREMREETGIDAAAWWTPDDLEADGTAASARLPEIMREAVRIVRGEG